ncbi:MAG: hypothetical protein E6090_02805, partial [Pantoea sp.]|nr:hypothetical protein [Pantoea sp.]
EVAEATMKQQDELILSHQETIRQQTARLAELEKQEPFAYTDNEQVADLHKITFAEIYPPHDSFKGDPDWLPLYLRPAPAVSLAELVPEDTKRMDWLISKAVNVRQPLPYGSHNIFWSQQTSDDSDENYTTDLREQIDAILRKIEEAE